jgi:hypothetical protein
MVTHSSKAWQCLISNTNSTPADGNANWDKILSVSTPPTLNSILPSQTGNSGKVLTTNGSNASWGTARFASVNFDGTTGADVSGTYTRTGTLVTATITAHGHITGHTAYVDFTTGGALDGWYDLTVIDANTFTFNTVASGAIATSNLTLTRRSIRKAVNVSNVPYSVTGVYAVNYTTLASDANYVIGIGVGGTGFSQAIPYLHIVDTSGTVRTPTTAYFNFLINNSGAGTNKPYVNVSVFA